MKYFGYFEKYEFNPKTNNMDSEIETLSTKVTYKNCKEFREYFWISLIKYLVVALLTSGLCLFLGLACTDTEEEKVGIVLSIIFPILINLISSSGKISLLLNSFIPTKSTKSEEDG